jgi:hypothetical protein
MAKPCRYQLPGTDTWMSESEFKKALNDGLIDQYVNDGVISIPNLKPKAATTPTAPVATEPAVETPAAPVAEVKEVKIPKNKKERIDAALKGTMVYHRVGDTIYESTPEQYNAALKEISETGSISNASNIGKKISKNQAPDPVLHGYAPNLEKISQEDAQYELGLRTKAETTAQPVAETKTESNEEKISRGADMLDKMSEEEMDNFIDDWFNDRIPREELPGGSDAIKLLEARKVAPKPMSKPKRLTIDNAFELSNEHGFIINIDGELYGLSKVEDPDATSDAEDKYGDPKEYVWVYSKIAEGIDGKTTETYTNDINEVIKDIKSSKVEPVAETKAEPTPVEPVAKEETPEYETTEVKPEGKTPEQIKQEWITVAKQSNGDYAIVEGRTGNQVVYKKNRKTGRWQGLTGKGEWVDVNDEMNAKANDAVNYTRKDKKIVILGTVKNGITSNDEFVYDFNTKEWKKRSEDGYLYGIGPELAAKAEQQFLKENPKRAAKNKAVDQAKQETRDAIGENMTPEIENTLNSKEFEDGVEVVEAPTAETETKKKPKKGNRHMATQRRGAAVGFAAGLIEQLEKVFPNLSRISGGLIVDQGAFDNIAGILGASPYAAALLHDGVIYLNPSVANGNTAFEEYAHVYLMAIEQINPSLYNRGLALVEQATEYIDEVVNDAEYAYIHGNKKYEDLSDSEKKKVQFEALSKMIADRAEKVFEDSRKAPIVTWIKELWQTIARVFKIGSLKLDLSRSSIDDYVKGIAKQLNRNSPISMINKDQLADLMDGDLSGVTVSRSVASPQSPASHWLRTNFFANKGLQENEAYRLKQARRDIQVWQNRVKDTVSDLNQAVKDYVKATGKNKVDVLLDVNQSLSDPVKRADWFSSDAQAEAMIKPVIESMRNQIDMLQAKLAASGLFNEDLTATITGNNDVYVNTSYYAFSGRNYKGDWMNLFSEAERNQILDWVYNGAYQTASKLNYKVSPTGGVEVTFQNGFGIETESLNFNNMDEFKQFLKDNAKLKLNGAPINLRKVKLGSGQGSLDFYAPMDISDAGIKFNANEAAIYGHLNEIVKDRESLSAFVHTQKSLTSSKAKSALKKKKNLDETYKLFLREIKDPATNYANTIAKQSEILYKGMMEQGIIDSGYLASKKASGNNTVLISDPGSRLRGYYVSPELNRFLNDRTPNLLDIVSAAPLNIFDRAKNKKMSTMGMAGDSLIGVATAASSLTKAYLTVLSIGSNAANYISGYFQLFKTGNMPFGMTSAMRALEQGFSSQKVFSKENSVAAVLNTVPTIIRAISNIANNSAMYNKGGVIGALSEDQKKYFGVSDFSQLTSQQKAKVLLEELTSTGVIGTNIDVEMLRELTETAFDNTIPAELVQGKIAQILGKAKQFKGDTWDAMTASYALSDSMFKAVMYLQEKQKNLDTYGSVLAKQGISPEVIEERMREKTAIDVRKQMPTYDRSPDIIKALSKFPLIGTFIQFDFQSKVNDKNIITDAIKMVSDSRQMRKEGYSEEANKLAYRSITKLSSLAITSTISYAIYNAVNAFISGFDDDDDEAMRSLMPEYRQYNMLLHLDNNKKGLHTYLDLSRIDPQTLYFKYFRALTEDGFDAMADELLKPYYTQDIFVGGLAETLMNLDKYGEASATIEKMSFIEKLEYFVSERILPSGVVGQVSKLLDAIEGGEASPGIDKDPRYELMNMYFGMKPRTVDIGKEYSSKIKFEHFDKIQGEHKVEFQDAKKELEKVQDQFDRRKTTKEKLNEAKMNLEEARVQANKDVADELKAARELTNKMRRLGYSDDEIRKILTDSDATRYMINILLDPSLKAEFDSEGKIGAGKPAKKPKKNSMYDNIYDVNYDNMYPSMY